MAIHGNIPAKDATSHSPDANLADAASPFFHDASSDGAAESSLSTQPSPPLLPDYELLRCIGRGSYGEVWLARSATGAWRAVKIVWRHPFEDDRPFQREFEGIQTFERLSRDHPSQLALFHVGRGEGYFYYVMELADAVRAVPGSEFPVSSSDVTQPETQNPKLETQSVEPETYCPHTLRYDLQTHGRLSAERVLDLGLALTTALAHLHENGLVHRDIKPSNIIFVNGRPKLADIGLVTDAGDARSIVGTEGYLAPEGPGTPQADIFALGKVFYEAATGLDRRQFPQLPPDLRGWSDAVLVFELNEIFLKACGKEPAQRYQSVEAMHDELELLHRGHSVKRQRAWQQTSSYAKKLSLVFGALAAVSAFAYWLSIRLSRPSDTAQSRPPEFVWSTNAAANDDFRQGMRALHAGGDNVRAIRYFESAIQKDPNFAEAYARLAWAHYSLADNTNALSGPAAAEKAVSLNPNLAYAHSMLATARRGVLNWAEAEKERALAVSLNPNSQEILLESALNLAGMGRTNEALGDLERARRANPDSASNKREWFYGLVYAWCRQYESAFNIFNQTGTGGYFGNQHRALAHLATGDFTNFMHFGRRAALAGARNPDEVNREFDALDKAFKEDGEQKYWELSLKFESSKQDPDHLMRMAAIHARLNQPDDAVRLLKRAMQETPTRVATGLYTNPSFDTLRTNEQFAAIVEELWRKK